MNRLSLLALVAVGIASSAAALAQEPSFPIAAWSRTTASAEDSGSPKERGAAVFNNWCSAPSLKPNISMPSFWNTGWMR